MMNLSPLQIALIVVAVIGILGVIAYNKWQERKAARDAGLAFGERGDALLHTISPRTVTGPITRFEPTLGPDSTTAATDYGIEFDDDIELIVSLSFDHVIDGERLAKLATPLTRAAGGKPVRVGATHAETHRIEIPHPGPSYSGLHAAVLLANRSGALTDVEFSEFVGALQRLADELDVAFDIPDMAETLARAQALDRRCAALDGQIAVNIVANDGGWNGLQIAQAAVEAGFAQLHEGMFAYLRSPSTELFRLHALDLQGRALPVVAPTSQVHSNALTVVLDVPRAPEVEKPLSTMINVSRAMAARLHGSVVDDNRRPVTDQALTGIETALKPRLDELRDAGFEAGSARALRLFG